MTSMRARFLPTVALAGAALLTLPAGPALAKRTKYPVVKLVSPLKAGVGDLMTIEGKGFRAGKNRNTVVFKRAGERAIFVKAESATRTVLKLHVPLKLQAYMEVTSNQPQLTRFRLRIISKRFGRKFTSRKLSPLIGPAGAGVTTPPPTPPTAYEQCLAAALQNAAGDQDSDSLSNGLEKSLGTDPCREDTDTDGMADGWEYQSALDLNSRAIPYPGKKPWPNALDPSDDNNDFDGDGLAMAQEYRLWQYSGARFNADGTLPAYSDGTQNTGGPVATTTPALQNLEFLNVDGNLTDEERDADGDGLSNFVEENWTGLQSWWTAIYTHEKPYTWRTFAELSATEPDSDGDGVLDGADDQDEDGWDNFQEMQLSRLRSPLRMQPYNPCLPDPYSRSCGRYVPMDASQAWPPFDGSEPIGAVMPFDQAGTMANPESDGWNGFGGPQGPGA